MVNPFDRNFFHFVVGFGLILSFSFSVLYFTGRYSNVLDGKEVATGVKNF